MLIKINALKNSSYISRYVEEHHNVSYHESATWCQDGSRNRFEGDLEEHELYHSCGPILVFGRSSPARRRETNWTCLVWKLLSRSCDMTESSAGNTTTKPTYFVQCTPTLLKGLKPCVSIFQRLPGSWGIFSKINVFIEQRAWRCLHSIDMCTMKCSKVSGFR